LTDWSRKQSKKKAKGEQKETVKDLVDLGVNLIDHLAGFRIFLERNGSLSQRLKLLIQEGNNDEHQRLDANVEEERKEEETFSRVNMCLT